MGFNNIHKSYAARFLRELSFFGAVSVPYFIDWLHVDYKRIFFLEAWFAVWIVLLEIPTGVVADRYGRKVSLALGSLFFALDLLIFGFTENYYVLYLAEFMGALGFALMSGADKALIYDSLIQLKKKSKAREYLSRHEAFGNLGRLVSLPLGSLIAGSGFLLYPDSLAFTFILSGIALIFASFMYLSAEEPRRHVSSENFVSSGIKGLKYLKDNKPLRAFAINSSAIYSLTFFTFWFYQSLLGSFSIGISYYGFVGAGFNLFAILLLLNVKNIEKFFGIGNVLFYSALIPSLLLIGVALTKNFYVLIAAIFIINGLRQIRLPILSDFMNRHIKSKNRATVLSSVSLLQSLIIVILYPIVGFLADMSLRYALLVLGILGLAFTFITRIEEGHLAD